MMGKEKKIITTYPIFTVTGLFNAFSLIVTISINAAVIVKDMNSLLPLY
jgi:hypothetical protein